MLYWLLMFFLIIFPLFWLRAIKGYSWKKTISDLLPEPKGWKKELTGSMKLLTLLLVAFVLLSVILTLLNLNDLDKVGDVIKGDLQSGILLYITLLVVIMFVEEFFFRAFLVKRTGVIISTIIFSIAHIGYGSIAEIIGVLVLGFIIAYWYKKNNSIIQTYTGHLMYNLIAIVLYLIF